MIYRILVIITISVSIVLAQEEVVSDTSEIGTADEDTSLADPSELVEELPSESQIPVEADTFAVEDEMLGSDTTVTDTSTVVDLVEVAPTLDAGYKGFGWGMTKEQLPDYVDLNSTEHKETDNSVVIRGAMGEDSVIFAYSFSDLGFWKVKIRYDITGEDLDDYIDQFKKVEKILTKRYGAPTRTTRNEMGTDREYLFSNFPKLYHAYFRSSWLVDLTNVELIFTAHVPSSSVTGIPIFNDLKPSFLLYYYNPSYFGITEPDTTSGITEEEVLKSY